MKVQVWEVSRSYWARPLVVLDPTRCVGLGAESPYGLIRAASRFLAESEGPPHLFVAYFTFRDFKSSAPERLPFSIVRLPARAISFMPHLSLLQWLFAVAGAMCIGISKSGFIGLSMLNVVIMAQIFPQKESTGIVLPMLIFGDICAVAAFQRHADWKQVRRMLPPTAIGVVTGWMLMRFISDARFGPVIGWTVLSMSLLQALRQFRPARFEHIPHSHAFAWSMGGLSGIGTMLANAAGPVMSLYFLALKLSKYELIGTSAWFFLLINLFKIPFSAQLGLIHGSSLLFNFALAPAVILGAWLGRRLVLIVPQKLFETLILVSAALASLRLIF